MNARYIYKNTIDAFLRQNEDERSSGCFLGDACRHIRRHTTAALPSLWVLYEFFVASSISFDSLNLADKKMFCIFAGVNIAEIETYR